jgi:UDP-N-acetylglucosamine--N-acetylmuramyl-(pentapeptide) pyrophosphoryl-undecaprenol N-acetylglucosamine transferase
MVNGAVTTVLIAGGGTGGHVFPMVAVGDALLAARDDVRVVYVGTARGLESKICGERGDHLELLDVAPLRGGGLKGFVKGVGRSLAVLPEARALVRRLDPKVCLSVGGYAGGPVALAARTLGVPVAILEPNSVLGLTNKLLSPLAVRAYTAFPETERYLRPSVIRRLGVPLRRAFHTAPFVPPSGEMRVLVIGGSQGAKFFNETVPDAVARARALFARMGASADLTVVHQCGKAASEVEARYRAAGVTSGVTVAPFLADVATALANAHVVIARCGASSCMELCAVGRPGIFIPFPFAADNHQWRNAKSLQDAGAVLALPQSEASPDRIASAIADLYSNPDRLGSMAKAAASLGKPNAAHEIATDLLSLVRDGRPSRIHAEDDRAAREGGVLRVIEGAI